MFAILAAWWPHANDKFGVADNEVSTMSNPNPNVINFSYFRWNSKFLQLESIHKQKSAVVQTLINTENAPVEFGNRDWELMQQIIRTLRPFYEVTEMLSKNDTSISMAIPTVTLIMKSLEEIRDEDMGVLGFKSDIKKEMEERFSDMESKEHYSVATLLDCRFKGHFFRNPRTRRTAKSILLEKLVERIRESITPIQVSMLDIVYKVSWAMPKINCLHNEFDTVDKALSALPNVT